MAVGATNYPTSLDTVVELIEAANNASTTLDGAIDNSVTTITVASTSSFAASGVIAIENELISYTAKTATDFTGCTRGFEGTAAAAHLTGVAVEQIITARSHNVLASAIIATQTKLGTGVTIALNKLATVTASRALVSDASGYVSASSVTATELGYLSGVTSAIQTQLGNKAATGAVGSSGLTMATDRLLGRTTASSGAIEEITVGSGLSLSGGTLTATGGGGSGTVTSVGLSLPAIFTVSNSPVTTSGTLTGALADQNANIVFAGPSTGAATAPTFRSLVAADIPGVLSITKLSNLTSNGFVKTGSGDGTLSVDTSTYLTANQTITLSGDVTGSGTTAITATIASAAVTYAKIQNVSATSRILGRKTAGAGSIEELTLAEALDFVGSAAQGDILFRGASGWTRLGAGTNGHYLQTQGAGANPQWAAAAGGGLTIGTTAITSGTAGRILYETSGNVVGEIAGSSVTAGGQVTLADKLTTTLDNATTNASDVLLDIQHSSSGTPAANFGSEIRFGLESTTTVNQDAGAFGVSWETATHATRKSQAYLKTYASSLGYQATAYFRPLDSGGGGLMIDAYGTLGGGSLWLRSSNGGGAHIRISPSYLQMGSGGSFAFYQSNALSGSPIFQINNSKVGIGIGAIDTAPAAMLQVTSSSASLVGLRVDSASNSTVALAQYYLNADDTSTPALHSVFAANSNGTAAAGFGGQLAFQAESSTTNSQDAAAINWLWTDATHATRTAKLQFQLVGNAAALATVAEFDMDGTAGNTRFLIYDVDNATLERVSVGAADSGGTGYKVLRIPN